MTDRPQIDDLDFRVLRDADVEALIACIRRCYGESYPDGEFYDPDAIRALLRSQRLFSAVAINAERRVVGHIGTRIPIAGDAVVETMGGIVDPDYRGLGVVPRIGRVMMQGYRERGVMGARHIATGAHDRTQRLIVASGGIATGVLLAHVPSGTEYREIEHAFGSARIGAVVYFQRFGAFRPLDVHVPTRLADRVASIYREIGLERTVRSDEAAERETRRTEPLGSLHHDVRAGTTILSFGSLASEPMRTVETLLDEQLSRLAEVDYADVPITVAWAPRLFTRLERAGFSFGALQPGTAASESIRLQRFDAGRAAPTRIVVSSEFGRALLDWIIEEQ